QREDWIPSALAKAKSSYDAGLARQGHAAKREHRRKKLCCSPAFVFASWNGEVKGKRGLYRPPFQRPRRVTATTSWAGTHVSVQEIQLVRTVAPCRVDVAVTGTRPHYLLAGCNFENLTLGSGQFSWEIDPCAL